MSSSEPTAPFLRDPQVYVIGREVFVAERPSIRDPESNERTPEMRTEICPVLFDALEGVPSWDATPEKSGEKKGTEGGVEGAAPTVGAGLSLDRAVAEAAAGWLRDKLGWSLFGALARDHRTRLQCCCALCSAVCCWRDQLLATTAAVAAAAPAAAAAAAVRVVALTLPHLTVLLTQGSTL